jgi:hypothetical protein
LRADSLCALTEKQRITIISQAKIININKLTGKDGREFRVDGIGGTASRFKWPFYRSGGLQKVITPSGTMGLNSVSGTF